MRALANHQNFNQVEISTPRGAVSTHDFIVVVLRFGAVEIRRKFSPRSWAVIPPGYGGPVF